MADLQTLRVGSSGKSVEKWQFFLKSINLYTGSIDGDFGPKTLSATIAFQQASGLTADGVVGNKSYAAAILKGFIISEDKLSKSWPPVPNFKPLLTDAQKHEVFGQFSFVANPQPDEPGNVLIKGDWQKKNIIKVAVPQLQGIAGTPNMWFHRIGALQVQKLWASWEDAGFLHLTLTWGGTFNPRFIRGSKTKLSQHAFGSAFDINMSWNGLGATPALTGQKGSVRELVEIANHHGFYWGGHFSRKDGMHFEIAKII